MCIFSRDLLWVDRIEMVCITCLIVEGVLLPMLWYFILDKSEREYLKGKILAGLKVVR